MTTYDRKVLVDVLVHHWPTNSSGCFCGAVVLGASFPEHVADVYERAVQAAQLIREHEAEHGEITATEMAAIDEDFQQGAS